MARLPDVERRLLNWARWKHGAGSGGGLGYGGWNMVPSGGRNRESVIPTSDVEASDTDEAVLSLEARLAETVAQVYLTGDSPAIDARKLGIGEAGVKARIWEAHRQIAAWLAERRAVREQERLRLARVHRDREL